MSPRKSDVEKKLSALQIEFKKQLSGKISTIEGLWKSFHQNNIKLTEMHRLVHGLAGAGGTFGATDISRVALKLEHRLKHLLNQTSPPEAASSDILQKIDELV